MSTGIFLFLFPTSQHKQLHTNYPEKNALLTLPVSQSPMVQYNATIIPQKEGEYMIPWQPDSSGLTPQQKRRAEQLISLSENDTIELQYGYAEDIHDGRGITAGRAGFTTADGDALKVVEIYTKKLPDNGLARFLPELRRLAKEGSGDTSHLNGYVDAWKHAANHHAFRAAQDQVVDQEYYQPSAQYADDNGLNTALARAALYDTIIQHGDGDDPDGLPALLQRTQDEVGGTPKTGVDEKTWLRAFLKIRRADLAHAYDPTTREAWAQSVDRCDAFSQIAAESNYDLHGPIHVHTIDHDATIP
jgi:chitosanase